MDIIAAIITFIAAAILLCLALTAIYTQLIIKRTKLMPIGDALSPTARGSLVAMQGQVECDVPLITPLSKTPCVYYKMKVEFGSKNSIASETRSTPFTLRDETGHIKIDASDDALFYADPLFDEAVPSPEQGDLKIGDFSRSSELIQRDTLQGTAKKQNRSRSSTLPHVPETSINKDDNELPAFGVDAEHNTYAVYNFNEEGIPVGCELYVRGEIYLEEDEYYLRKPKYPIGTFRLLSKIKKGTMVLSTKDKSGFIGTTWLGFILFSVLSGLLFALGFYVIQQ